MSCESKAVLKYFKPYVKNNILGANLILQLSISQQDICLNNLCLAAVLGFKIKIGLCENNSLFCFEILVPDPTDTNMFELKL